MGPDDPRSTILIDGVPVEGVEEFIYLGSKQSSNGYCRPDVLRRIGLACSVIQVRWLDPSDDPTPQILRQIYATDTCNTMTEQ